MSVKTFEELFIYELSDIYNAEKQLLQALPKLVEAVSDNDLANAFSGHLKETEGQVERIERLAKLEGLTLKSQTCQAMKGLIREGDEAIAEFTEGPLRDVAIITAAQKVEHYEISGYGTLIQLAKQLGYKHAFGLLTETLSQEKGADEKLSSLATAGGINRGAQVDNLRV
ncbi:MAG: ferritin-like domain-containing protein [Micavibrio sp.]|nr:ferritin-like domain-containing protein [Micavibrio sp.]